MYANKDLKAFVLFPSAVQLEACTYSMHILLSPWGFWVIMQVGERYCMHLEPTTDRYPVRLLYCDLGLL